MEAWERAIGAACSNGQSSAAQGQRSRIASDLMSNDETINDALREAETAVSEIDIAGSGRISLDLLSLLFAQVGIPVEHQAPLRQDLLSTEEAQGTLHLGYIEDSCFFAWFASLKKNELRAGAGGFTLLVSPSRSNVLPLNSSAPESHRGCRSGSVEPAMARAFGGRSFSAHHGKCSPLRNGRR